MSTPWIFARQTNRRQPGFVRLTLACLALAAVSGPVWGQSAAQLRAENERLKSQVGDLQADLAAARARIETLEQENLRLRQALQSQRRGGGGGSDPAAPVEPAPAVSIDETVPTASPRALLRAAEKGYAEAEETWEAKGGPTSRNIRTWIQAFNREHRKQVTWRVQVKGETRRGGDLVLSAVAVDPKTAAVLGEPFDIAVPRLIERRWERDRRAAAGVTVWDVTGQLTPRLRYAAGQSKEQAFGPPLAGPFAAFAFAFEATAFAAPAEAGSAGGG